MARFTDKLAAVPTRDPTLNRRTVRQKNSHEGKHSPTSYFTNRRAFGGGGWVPFSWGHFYLLRHLHAQLWVSNFLFDK
jgi:hypothetical protein